MKFAARIFGFLIALIVLFVVVNANHALAQDTSNQTNFPLTSNMDPNVPKDMHYWTQNVMIETMSSMICQLTGFDPVKRDNNCLGINPQTKKIGFVKSNGGAIALMGNLITAVYEIPIHTSDFIAYSVNNFGIAKSAHAQNKGIGFEGLQPVQGMFLVFRNISYLLMMIIFIAIGIAVMLRLHIDPRTVMTIQNQIPKLIIGLVLITFSYAIAGLMVDAMWVSNYLVIDTLTPNDQHDTISSYATNSSIGFANDLFGGNETDNPGGILGLSFSAAGSVGTLVKDLIASRPVTEAMTGAQSSSGCIGICIMDSLMQGFWNVIGALIGFVAGIIVFLIFAIAIVVALFRLWFSLLKCFIYVLISVILGPVWILAGLIPGVSSGMGFMSWAKNLAGNLAPFPATLFVFVVARNIMSALSGTTSNTMFNPPLIGNVSGDNQTMFGALIAVGFILAAPSIVEKVRKSFGAGGSGLSMSGMGTGQAAVAGFAGGVASRMYYRDPRSGQMRGFIGSRVQRFTLGSADGSENVRLGTLRKATGFALRAPSHDQLRNAGVSDIGSSVFNKKTPPKKQPPPGQPTP